MFKIFTKLFVVVILVFTANTYSVSQEKRAKDLYIDSLAREFIALLEEDSIYNYIVYSETSVSGNNLTEGKVCESSKVLYLFWEKDSVRYMKKFDHCYDYQYAEIDYMPLIISLFREGEYYIKNYGYKYYCKEKNDFYDSITPSSGFKRAACEIYSSYYSQEIFVFAQKNESEQFDRIILDFQKFIKENDKYLRLKNEYALEKELIEWYEKKNEIPCYFSLNRKYAQNKTLNKPHSDWVREKNMLFEKFEQKEKEYIKLSKLQKTKYQEIYMDSLVEMYVQKLKNEGINDYIIYSETDIAAKQISKEKGCNSNRISYLFWIEDTSTYVKKIIFCYDYEAIQLNISQLLDYLMSRMEYFLKYSDKNACMRERNSYYISPYCSLRYWNTNTDIQFHLYDKDIYCHSRYNWSEEHEKLKNIIQKVLFQNDKKFDKKTRYVIPNSFARTFLEDIEKSEKYKTQLVKEWLSDSLPIHEDSLKRKPRLIQEAYYLYEYLMQKDTFIAGYYYRKKLPNFWVTGISVGQYEKDSVLLSFKERDSLKIAYIDDFRPRPFKGYRMLYPNEKISIYTNSEYCKYGPLPVSMNYHRYMSGVSVPKPSFPNINSIYFNKDFTEAQVYYSTGYNYSACIIRKNGEAWELIKDHKIMFID